MNDMPVDKEKAIEIAQEYKVLSQNIYRLKPYTFIAPYSKGNQTEDSDIDIAVVVDT